MGPPTAGIAFGSRSKMGAVAEPLLAKTVTEGRSAVFPGKRDRDAGADECQDPDERVRTTGAGALARWETSREGRCLRQRRIKAASEYQTEASQRASNARIVLLWRLTARRAIPGREMRWAWRWPAARCRWRKS